MAQASCTELPLCFLFIQNNNQICFPFFRASPNLLPYSRASPMKVIKIPASGPHSAFQQQISSENASNMPPGVKVVKLSAASTMVTNQRVAYTSQVTIRFYFNKQSGNSNPFTRKRFTFRSNRGNVKLFLATGF